MTTTLSGTVGLNVTNFRKNIADMRRGLRLVKSEWAANAAALGKWSDSATGIEGRLSALNQAIPLQEGEVAALKERYEQLAAEQGESSSAAQNMLIRMNHATKSLNLAKAEAAGLETQLEGMNDAQDDSGKAATSLKSKLGKLVGGLKSIVSMAASVGRGLGKMVGKLKAVGTAAVKATGKLITATARAAKTVAVNMAKIAAALVVGVGLLLASTVGPASDLNETLSKTKVVFGDAAAEVLAFGKTSASALGMSENAALGAAATYGNLLRATGLTEEASAEMSMGLVQLAADLASFNNIDPDVALEKLRAGLTGEAEPLKTLGINMNMVRLKAKAMELGLISEGEALTSAAKAQAAYAIMLEDSSLAQDDFARTAEGLANQERILSANLIDLRATLGTAVLPVVTAVKTKFNDMFAAFRESGGLATLTENLGHLGAAITGLISGTVGIETVGTLFGRLFSGLGDSMGDFDLGAILGNLLSGIGKMGLALNLGSLGLDIISGLVDSIVTGLPGLIEAGGQIIEKLVGFISEGLPKLIEAAIPLVLALVTGVIEAIPLLLAAADAIIISLLDGLIIAIPLLIPAAISAIGMLAKSLLTALPLIISAAVQIILALVSGLALMLPDLIPVAVAAILSIVETIATNLPLVIEAAIQIILALVEGLISMLPELIPIALGALLSIVDTLLMNLPMLIDAALQLIMALIEGLILAIPMLSEAVPLIVIAFNELLIEMLPQIAATAGELIGTLARGIIESIPLIIGAAIEILNALVEFWVSGDVIDMLSGIGTGIVEGIWKGIKNAWEWLTELLKGLLASLLAAAMDKLGASSPSKVFADKVGDSIPTGIGAGIKAAMPKLRHDLALAMDTLVGMTPDLAAAGVAAGSATSYQITMPLAVYGGASPDMVRTAAGDGVLRALRAAGVR